MDKTFLIFPTKAQAAATLSAWNLNRDIDRGHYLDHDDSGGPVLVAIFASNPAFLDTLEAEAAAGKYILLPEMIANATIPKEAANHPKFAHVGLSETDTTYTAAMKLWKTLGWPPAHPTRYG